MSSPRAVRSSPKSVSSKPKLVRGQARNPDAGRHIGIAAASLCNLFDPERLVIGGELAQVVAAAHGHLHAQLAGRDAARNHVDGHGVPVPHFGVVLTLDDSDLLDISAKQGFMDVKRISGGEPYEVFAPLKVSFKDTVTV